MNDHILTVKNLHKTYAEFTAVNNISFQVKRGEILGILGPNGAGKTTTVQMILGTLTPTSGTINVPERIGFASTYVEFSSSLTIYENLKIHGLLYGMERSALVPAIEKNLKRFDVWSQKDKTSNMLSAGQKTRTMLATAYLPSPSLILFDEPTASLDPEIAYEVRHFILEQQREEQTTILITSHNMAEVEQICDRVLVLKDGVIIANNTPKALAASISIAKIQLNVGDQLVSIIDFVCTQNLAYTIKDCWIEIEIDEHSISDFLTKLSKAEIGYSEISIDKPTLEDYFLHIAKR